MTSRRPIPPAFRPLLALGGVGAVMMALGRPSAAVVAWVAAPLLAQAVTLSPSFVDFVDQRMTPAIGRIVAFVLLGPIHVLVLVPAAAVSRLLGLDPLTLTGGDGRWQPRAVEGHTRVRRSFSSERAITGSGRRSSARAAIALVAVGVVAGLITPGLLDKADRDVPTGLRSGDGFDAMKSPALADADWAPQASQEFFEAVAQGQTYTPYVGYSLLDFSSTYVNVRDRQRVSYVPAGLGEDVPEVWFFGGSTMFGFSAQRDGHTIPSEVARIAEVSGEPILVRNYGEPGYVNFQETVLLAQLLLAGGRPDAVVFYDGINDLAVQLQRGFAFGEQGELGDLFTEAVRAELAGKLTGSAAAPTPLNPELAFADGDAALAGLERTMAQGVELGRTLADRYGFTVIHTWQPDLYSKASLDPGEQAVIEPMGFDDFRFDAFDEISDGARRRLPASIVDLGSAYDELDGPILNDQVHTNEAGARAVAEAIHPLVRGALAKGEGP